jgi:hypothetical protein
VGWDILDGLCGGNIVSTLGWRVLVLASTAIVKLLGRVYSVFGTRGQGVTSTSLCNAMEKTVAEDLASPGLLSENNMNQTGQLQGQGKLSGNLNSTQRKKRNRITSGHRHPQSSTRHRHTSSHAIVRRSRRSRRADQRSWGPSMPPQLPASNEPDDLSSQTTNRVQSYAAPSRPTSRQAITLKSCAVQHAQTSEPTSRSNHVATPCTCLKRKSADSSPDDGSPIKEGHATCIRAHISPLHAKVA